MENNLNKQRILVNKYTDNPSDIISSVFHDGFGEIILSVKAGEEGIYIKNDAGEVIKIGVEKSVVENIVKEIIGNQLEDITGEQVETIVKESVAAELENIVNTINDESERAIAEEERLQGVIDEEIKRSTEADQNLTNTINSEIAKLIVEQTKITESINNEINRATIEEQKLSEDLGKEVKRATDAEKEISENLQTLSEEVGKINNNIGDVVGEIVNEKLASEGVPVHQDISESQYKELIENGEVTIINNKTGKKETIKYSDDTYYMVYDDIDEPSFVNNEVVLESNWTPQETIILESGDNYLDLNNFKIIAPEFIDDSDNSTNSIGIWVKEGANLTIDGDGEIISQDAMYSMAVWANGGTVRINGGTFRNSGDGCDLIYASNGGRVEIYGGEFIATEYKGVEAGTGNKHSALNIKNSDRANSDILVYGGRFYGFDPANNVSEPNPSDEWLATHPNGFVAEGYKSVQDGDYWVVVKNVE